MFVVLAVGGIIILSFFVQHKYSTAPRVAPCLLGLTASPGPQGPMEYAEHGEREDDATLGSGSP